jgi:transformation/transcription domain-associated protein
MRDVALLLLNKAQEERAMNVSDAFLKLREQILAYFNPSSDLERHGGLNLINTTNLSFFDPSQKSELFRLKAMFLASLGGRSKANQAYCHSLQICPSHARAWDSWGELCSSLGAVAEKQAMEQCGTSRNGDETSKEQKLAAAKKVSQYLAQAMGCYLEAIQIDGHEWARMRIPKCLWMLQKDGPSPGVLCQTLENRGSHLPPWVFLPWIPQLLTSLYRREGRAVKSIFTRLVKMYPQAVYYPLRAYYLERRDVERVKGSSSSSSSAQHHGSVSYAEELMSLLRRSHASLWSSLEAVLEELIVKFRPTYDEELLSTIIALLERAETQVGNISKKDEESIVASVWKTLGKIAVKFFRAVDPKSLKQDARARKTAQFKEVFKESFEADFDVSATETEPGSPSPETKALRLEELLGKLRRWKLKLEDFVLSTPDELSLVETSHSLAMFGVSDAPDLWPRACDPYYASSQTYDRETTFDTDTGTTQSSTSSSAAAARKAATAAADAAASAAKREGVGGDYGGGSSWIEVPGQYVPTASTFTDVRPSPELHAKVLKFESSVEVLKRNDQLVRRIGVRNRSLR